MKTKQGTIYIADDGTEYASEDAAAYHELEQAIYIYVDSYSKRANLTSIFNTKHSIPIARAYLEYAKLKWPEEFNK